MKIALPDALRIDLLECWMLTKRVLLERMAATRLALARAENTSQRLEWLRDERSLLASFHQEFAAEKSLFRRSPVLEKVEELERRRCAELEAVAVNQPDDLPFAFGTSDMLLRIVEHYWTAVVAHGLPVNIPSLERVANFARETRDFMSFDQATGILLPVMKNALLGHLDLWAEIQN